MQRSALVSASLTCRAWLDICAPKLYRDIFISSSRTSELIAHSAKAGSRVALHAERLRIDGAVPWLTLPRLLEVLPGVRELEICPSSWLWNDETSIADAYHPSLPRLMSGVLAVSQQTLALTSLQLTDQCFSSSAAVLRLVALFPLLQKVRLMDCTVEPRFEHPFSTPSTHLTNITMEYCLQKATVHPAGRAHLALWWQLRHPANDVEVGPYPGLHHADMKSVCSVLKSIDTPQNLIIVK